MKSAKLIVGALALLAIVGVQPASRPAAAAELELKMQFASPDGTPWNDMDRRFAKQIEEITGGRAKVVFYPPNSVTTFKRARRATAMA